MESIQHISKIDLLNHPHQVIDIVQNGQTAIIEEQGQAEAALIDIIDYRLMQAALHYYTKGNGRLASNGLEDEQLAQLESEQARYNVVLGHYLTEAISLARLSELLDRSWLNFRLQFLRLGIPVRSAPATVDEAKQDFQTALTWLETD